MSLKKKERRIIRVKNSRLRAFRTEMRRLLKAAQISERRALRFKSNSVDIDDFNLRIEEEDKIEKKIEELDRALFRSPIGCRVCARHDLDLIFNPYSSEWFCEHCYTSNQEFYKKNPHPCQPDWRKLYP